jgi:hypothetical protein
MGSRQSKQAKKEHEAEMQKYRAFICAFGVILRKLSNEGNVKYSDNSWSATKNYTITLKSGSVVCLNWNNLEVLFPGCICERVLEYRNDAVFNQFHEGDLYYTVTRKYLAFQFYQMKFGEIVKDKEYHRKGSFELYWQENIQKVNAFYNGEI